ncbi:MAG: M28 family peptidase, partial [Gemmatimonadota bacterium]|nr:M28 family peptidase [Gemmatimonadota bacterium]
MTAGRTRHRGAVTLLLLGLGACATRPARPPSPRVGVIDTLALRAHTFFLADDLLLGRETGSQGSATAALYLEAQCRAQGLQPVGGSYRHPVPLEAVVPLPDTTFLRVGARAFTVGTDFLITGGTQNALRGFSGAAVLVGSADDLRRNPDGIPRLDGAVAVLHGVARADVAALLARRGAAGILQIVDDPATFALYLASRGTTLTVLREPGIASSFYADLPTVLVGPTVATVLGQAGTPIELHAVFDRHPLTADNITCLLPGTDASRGDTAIVFTAHYDHLGVSLPDASGDSVYNGFSDNAVGVAMLLGIADALRQRPEGGLRHSALFLFFTGEERGLLGSDYFVARPPYPLERMRALINLDAGAPPARPWTWRLAGGERTPLGEIGRDVAAVEGWSATLSAATANSDYFPFARAGVPAVFIVPGSAPYEGLSADSSQALRRRWDRYHL